MPSKREAMVARANTLVGCGYIYGATGWICTQKRLDQQAKQYPMYAQQIERYGPKWLGKPCYDCAQLTREVARQAGVSLPSGATSQWRASSLWSEQDVIDTLPREGGLFLYTMRDGRMTHTGVTVGDGEEVDARGHAYGVVRRTIPGTSFTHWARLAIDYDAPAEEQNAPAEPEKRRTLRRGMKGEDVKLLQQQLAGLGYELGASGADGVFGQATKAAVERFQRDRALSADGVVGAATWAALDAAQPGEEEEPEAITRLCLSGAALSGVLRAAAEAKKPLLGGGNVRLELRGSEYEELMRLIQAEG